MAIYRAEQARVSFASEPGHGGYTDFISASTQSGWSGTVNGAVTAGSRSFAFDGGSGTVAVDQYIRIGSVGTATGGGFNAEIRKVTKVDGATVYVDHPFGFHHLDNEAVSQTTIASAITGDSLLTFLPGVYDAVACPDLTPEITPYYFMSTSGNRNWTMAYRGRQTFNGSIGNMLLLNGYPIRFPIGSVATTGTDVGSGGGSTLSGATSKGHIEITVADGSGINLQEDITFTGATTENLIKMPDNLADALNIKEGITSYIKFATTNGSELITFGQNVDMNSKILDNAQLQSYKETIVTVTNSGGTVTFDMGAGNIFTSMGGSAIGAEVTTLVFQGMTAGQSATWIVEKDGARDITFATVKRVDSDGSSNDSGDIGFFPSGEVPDCTAIDEKIDMYTFFMSSDSKIYVMTGGLNFGAN